MLLAIDPSIRCAGWSLFTDDGPGRSRLQRAGTVDQNDTGIEERIVGLLEGVKQQLDAFWFTVSHVAVEFPRVYPGPQEENPNDLFPMAAQVGALLTVFGFDRVTLIEPKTWKGNVEKHAFNERILARLTPAELARVPKQKRARKHPYNHNMVDAIGIGLHHLGRLAPRREEAIDYASKGLTVYRRGRRANG